MALSRRGFIVTAGGGLLASTLPAWSRETEALRGPAFGASWMLVAPAGAAAAVAPALEEIVASVDAAMSPFRADSELSRFNRSGETGWQPLSAETCAVAGEGLRVAALTGDAFNPTVGPLVARYGFGPIGRGAAGSPAEIAVRDGAARKARPDLSLDLCGIAKGHALGRMVAACEAHGLCDFLIELGGEVSARGRHPAGRAWQVGIEARGAVRRVAVLDGTALATSGDAVNAFSYHGRRYAHIIDPATGLPADTPLASVTIAAASAMTADALATALFAMGADRGPAFARSNGIEALFVVAEKGGMRESATGGFEARLLA